MQDEFQGTRWPDDAQGLQYSVTQHFWWGLFLMVIFQFGLVELMQTLFGQDARPVMPSRDEEVISVVFYLVFWIFSGLRAISSLQPQNLIFDRESRRVIGWVTGPFMFRTKLNVRFD